MSGGDDRRLDLDYRVPENLRVGVYANAARIRCSPYEFTFDWAVVEPDPDDPEDAAPFGIVCSRVRIPVGLVFDVLQGVNRAMTFYERAFGEIRRPGDEA